MWKETFAAGKFGESAAKLILVEENLANLLVLILKVVQQNSSVISEAIVYDKTLIINAIASCMGLSIYVASYIAIVAYL